MRVSPTAVAIVLALLAFGAFYTYAETAVSERLSAEKQPPAAAQQTSHHTTNADCATCHAHPHNLTGAHSEVPCAQCHIADDDSSVLSSPASACARCHEEAREALPSLTALRGYSSLRKARTPTGLLRPTCESCHHDLTYNRPLLALTHPVRSVGAHLNCLKCHDLLAGSFKSKAWSYQDYSADFCFDCHENQRREFLLNDRHSLRKRSVSCRECHPPHQPLAANLTLEALELAGERILMAYDPIESNALCLKCHSYLDIVGPQSRFNLPVNLNLHELHLVRTYAACVECHNPHGEVEPEMVRSVTLESEPFLHFKSDLGGSCSVKCHFVQHTATQYLHGEKGN